MLNMVPSSVTLTEPITLLHAKVFNVQLTLEHGEHIFRASLRVCHPYFLSLSSAYPTLT